MQNQHGCESAPSAQPVIVIDNFLDQPELLIELAAEHSAFDGVSDAFYPGARAAIPPIYCFALRAFLGAAMADVFDLKNSAVTGELSPLLAGHHAAR